jgi:hypothetical protein
MDNLTFARQHILDECREDYVGLWSIVREVQDIPIERSKIVETTLALLRGLLVEGKIVAGTFHGERFQKWEMPVNSIIARIDLEWRKLGRDPNIGEIVWFTASDESAEVIV